MGRGAGVPKGSPTASRSNLSRSRPAAQPMAGMGTLLPKATANASYRPPAKTADCDTPRDAFTLALVAPDKILSSGGDGGGSDDDDCFRGITFSIKYPNTFPCGMKFNTIAYRLDDSSNAYAKLIDVVLFQTICVKCPITSPG